MSKNVSKKKLFWGSEPLKNKDNEPHQNFSGFYKKS